MMTRRLNAKRQGNWCFFVLTLSLFTSGCGSETDNPDETGEVGSGGATGGGDSQGSDEGGTGGYSLLKCSGYSKCALSTDCVEPSACLGIRGCDSAICIDMATACEFVCVGGCGTMDSEPPAISCESEMLPVEP